MGIILATDPWVLMAGPERQMTWPGSHSQQQSSWELKGQASGLECSQRPCCLCGVGGLPPVVTGPSRRLELVVSHAPPGVPTLQPPGNS